MTLPTRSRSKATPEDISAKHSSVAEGGGLDETDDHYGQPLTEPLLMHLLSECTDIMPRLLCGDLNLEPGSTYADGVAVLRAERPEWAVTKDT